MATFISNSPAETEALAEAWGRAAQSGLVVGLSGDLGAGKTQLVKGFARGLGITERIHSPTFSLVNIYTSGRIACFHLDVYRLETAEQIASAGIEQYLQPDGVTLIEWAERLWPQLSSQPSAIKNPPQLSTIHYPLLCASSASPNSPQPVAASTMKILALEFSSAQRSVAVADFSTPGRTEPSAARPLTSGPHVISEVVETGGKGTRAFEMIESALRDSALGREQLDCLAVGLGPGSYTGIRVAISIAQGWQLATNIKIAAVPTPDILAAQAHSDGFHGKLHVIIDAQRNELYWTAYDLTDSSRRPALPLRLARPVDVQAAVAGGDLIAGPEANKWFPEAKLLHPSAAVLAQLAFEGQTFIPAEKLEPIYLRETTFIKAPAPRIV